MGAFLTRERKLFKEESGAKLYLTIRIEDRIEGKKKTYSVRIKCVWRKDGKTEHPIKENLPAKTLKAAIEIAENAFAVNVSLGYKPVAIGEDFPA